MSDLPDLLRSLTPVLNPGVFVFCEAGEGVEWGSLDPIATFRESEGLTVVIRERVAAAQGLTPRYRAAWITLTVHSDLQAVGLTAVVSSALSDGGISCNIIAAVHHDHLFVPVDRADDAMRILESLQRSAR